MWYTTERETSASLGGRAVKKISLDQLDDNERYVLHGLAIEGYTLERMNQEIGNARNCLDRVRQKLSVSRHIDLARRYVQLGGDTSALAGRDLTWKRMMLRDRRVAALASISMENKEIAQCLSFNVNLVKASLRSAYPALRIFTRYQLPAVLANISDPEMQEYLASFRNKLW